MSPLPNREFLNECENLIRSGRMDLVHKKMAGLNTAQVDRPLRLPMANLARRAGLIAIGLKLLRPVARPEAGSWIDGASPHELAEYGVLLQKSGAIQEALWTLNQVRADEAPDALLYRAFCHFSRWEYAEAAALLERYVHLERRAYQRLVGTVNLTAALNALERWTEAESTVEEVFRAADDGGFLRVRANGLELRSQIRVHQGRYQEARADLTEAASILQSSQSVDQLSIRKSMAILDSLETRDPFHILSFRQEAVRRGSWESVREADRILLKVRFDQALFEKLLFGTPFTFFRRRLLADHSCEPPRYLLYGSRKGVIFDLQTGSFTGGTLESPPHKMRLVLTALTRDFYRPMSAGGMFAELFPGEYFDIFSSINRVHQLVFRTRRWLAQAGVPAKIDSADGTFGFTPGEGFGLLIPYDHELVPRENVEARLSELNSIFGSQPFSSREVCPRLGLSASSFKLLMNRALENGRVVRLGRGRSTRYQFLAWQRPVNQAA
jgi:hypothetical protein